MADGQLESRAPLTPPDCRVSDWPGYMIDVHRLQKSKAWLIARRKPHLGFYMLNLWMAAWNDTPGGSLENDDDVLADRAKCDPERWAEIKEDALRGFVVCTDGRLYHEVVAIRVLEAWLTKLSQRISSGHGNAKKYNGAFDDRQLRTQIELARDLLSALDPVSTALSKRHASTSQAPKKPGRAPRKTAPKPAPDVPPAAGLPAGAGADAGGIAREEKGREGKVTVGGKPPTTPGAGAPDGDSPDGSGSGSSGDQAKPPPAPRGKALLKPPFELVLPEWMPREDWAKFMDMRMRMGKSIPFTEAAALGLMRKLEKLRDEGHDVTDMLDAAIRNGWRDVFAPRGQQPTRTSPPASGGRYAGAAAAVFGTTGNKGVVIDA